MSLQSLLYVPASRRRMLAKVRSIDVDAVVVDLEDGVAPGNKERARETLAEAVGSGELGVSPAWWLRVNAPGSPWYAGDEDLARELRPAGLILPKAERPEAVRRLADRTSDGAGSIGLMIETATGVGRVRELAAVDRRVDLLVLGSADLRLSLGARQSGGRDWELGALRETLLAARMHGCRAIDSVYFHYRDLAGLRAHAQQARDLGFDGKSCIHPCQVPVIHEVFAPTQDEIAWARAVRRVWAEQRGEVTGVVVLEGEMIEALHVEVAERTLAGRRAG